MMIGIAVALFAGSQRSVCVVMAHLSALTMEGGQHFFFSNITGEGGWCYIATNDKIDEAQHFRAPPYDDPFAGNKMLPGEIDLIS